MPVDNKLVKIWLWIGVVLVFFQIVIGGITRLTGSGLSITKWEIVTGTVPPLNEADWNSEFDLYKQTPQYEKINDGMTLPEFQFIYFWEFFHRLWARSMGFIFLFPFLFFLYKKQLPKWLLKDLGVVILMAALAASFGWIMVASGLQSRPWVSAYKLTIHLLIGFSLFAYLFWATLKANFKPKTTLVSTSQYKKMRLLIIFIFVQIALGGLMSGMKAGLAYPTWPDMNGQVLPLQALTNLENFDWKVIDLYDQFAFMPALVQVLHRGMAYFVFGFVVWFWIKGLFWFKDQWTLRKSINVMGFVTCIQVLLGVLTIIACKGNIPVGLGSLHQTVAILLVASSLWVFFQMNENKNAPS